MLLTVFPPDGSVIRHIFWHLSVWGWLLTNEMVGYSCPDQSASAVNGPLLKMHSLSGGGHVEPSFSSLGLVVKLKLGIFFASMISVSCFLALGLLSSTATGSGLPPAGIPGSIQRNLVEPRRSEPLKRSTGVNEQTCTAPPGAESNLRSNTHSVSDSFTCFL